MKQNNYCIYLHRNKINGKIYVGQTCQDPIKRWSNGNGYKKQYFYKAIEKYGWNGFEHIILETGLTAEEAEKREQFWINYYHSILPEYGYNRIKGSSISNETREKMRQSWKKPQRKELQRKVALKIPKKDMSGKNNPMYGIHRYGDKAPRKKQVECIETKQIFSTVKEAAEWLGSISQKSHISEVCKGKRKSCGIHPITKQKLTWRYID